MPNKPSTPLLTPPPPTTRVQARARKADLSEGFPTMESEAHPVPNVRKVQPPTWGPGPGAYLRQSADTMSSIASKLKGKKNA